MFSGNEKILKKVKPLLQGTTDDAPSVTTSNEMIPAISSIEIIPDSGHGSSSGTGTDTALTAIAIEGVAGENSDSMAVTLKEPLWVQFGKCTLLQSDKECLLSCGASLTDKHINFAQLLFKNQFGYISELQSVQELTNQTSNRITNHSLTWMSLGHSVQK